MGVGASHATIEELPLVARRQGHGTVQRGHGVRHGVVERGPRRRRPHRGSRAMVVVVVLAVVLAVVVAAAAKGPRPPSTTGAFDDTSPL